MFIEEESSGEGGGNTPSTSVEYIAPYQKMLMKAIKRNNIFQLTDDEYAKTINLSEIDIIEKYKKKPPFLLSNGKKYTLLGKV